MVAFSFGLAIIKFASISESISNANHRKGKSAKEGNAAQ
jgi:hypothetical protein